MIRNIIFTLIIIQSCAVMYAQETAIFRDANEAYKHGMELYEQGLFGAAQQEFRKIKARQRAVHQANHDDMLVARAGLYDAMCAIRLKHPDSERLALDFIRDNEPSDIADVAKLEISNYYFNEGQYDQAIGFLENINEFTLSNEQIIDRKFKLAYSYFVTKNFVDARILFNEIRDIQDEYYYPANYYYGVAAFFDYDYESALAAFQKVDASKKYGRVVPYYIAQIYFARGEYDELIAYATPLSQDPAIRYRLEINKLIGSAWFERGDYMRALPYFITYNEQALEISEKDAYQLAFTQYQLGQYEQAIPSFEELRGIDSRLGQNALYNLADSYLRTGEKTTARNAFLLASRMEYDREIQEISRFNYAKVSYDLGNDRDAIRALQSIPRTSPYHNEAQALLSDVFVNSRDYEKALELLERMPGKNAELVQAYQKVAYARGVQLYNDERFNEARAMFNRSLQSTPDRKTKALSKYWLGEMSYVEEDYNKAILHFNDFLNIASRVHDLPDEASEYIAHYNLGYAYLRQGRYDVAAGHFQDAVNGLRLGLNYVQNPYIKDHVLPDATLRAADSYFKTNNYLKATEYYDDAIKYKYEDYHYALFQRAIIQGLRNPNDPAEGLIAMENLYKKHPDSDYADDAIFSNGVTYLDAGNYTKAQSVFEILLNRYPKSEYLNQTLLKLGLIHINQGEYRLALGRYKDVFKYNPNSQEAEVALKGVKAAYLELDDLDGFITFKQNLPGYEVTDLEKENILFNAAETHYENGDYTRAANAYTKYLKVYPRSTSALSAYYRRAESLYILKKYDKSYADYVKVIEKGSSNYAEPSASKAALIAYNHLQDFDAALKWYERQLVFVGDNEIRRLKPLLGAVRSAYRSGKLSDKMTLATELRTDDRLSKRERGEVAYYIAKSALDDNNLQMAREYFNEVITLTDDERAAEAHYQIAHIYYLQRDLDLAQRLAVSANKEIAGYEYWLGKSVVLLGDIFTDRKDYFNARAALETILENYTKDDDVMKAAKEKLLRLDELEKEESRIIPEAEKDSDNLQMEEDQ